MWYSEWNERHADDVNLTKFRSHKTHKHCSADCKLSNDNSTYTSVDTHLNIPLSPAHLLSLTAEVDLQKGHIGEAPQTATIYGFDCIQDKALLRRCTLILKKRMYPKLQVASVDHHSITVRTPDYLPQVVTRNNEPVLGDTVKVLEENQLVSATNATTWTS